MSMGQSRRGNGTANGDVAGVSFVLVTRRKKGREECAREAADGTVAGRTLRGTNRMGGEEHVMWCTGTMKRGFRRSVVAGIACALGMFVSVASGEGADQVTVMGEVPCNGQFEVPTVVLLSGCEAHLARLEERLENYQQGQAKAVADRDAAWANRLQQLDADITERYKTDLQNEANAIRSTYQTNLAVALAENKADYNRYSATLRQCEEGWRKETIGCGFTTFCIIVCTSLLVLFIVALIQKGVGNNWLYCFEVVVLMAVLVLISFGAFHLLSRIVDGVNGGGGQGIVSPDGNKAILQAYEQLSNELGRWGALLGILGSFFGLVLPAGGYLLQIKNLKREEEKTARQIQEKVEEARKDIQGALATEVKQIWKEYTNIQYVDSLKSFHQIRQQSTMKLTVHELKWPWIQWISSILSVMQSLNRVTDDAFVRVRINSLIEELVTVRSLPQFAIMAEALKVDNAGKKCQIEGGIESLLKKYPDEIPVLIERLGEYGIVFIEKG